MKKDTKPTTPSTITNDDDKDKNCQINRESTSVVNQPSLQQFYGVYSENAAYQDLFIYAKGRKAVRYSFELIGMFWDIQIVKIGPPSQHTKTDTKPTPTNTVRVPYTISQRPKGLFSFMGWYQYDGWIDLHLRQENEDRRGHDHHQQQNQWKVYDHDDRFAFYGRKEDTLTTIQGIPLVGTLFHSFRLAHGSIVEYIAHRRTDDKD
jgi:hypothetical protein